MNRNQLCSCGSGKRYKHCHGATAEAETVASPAAAALRPDPIALLHHALAAQKDGRLAAAEGLYEQALAMLPGHFDALHMLGVVKLQLGKFDEGTRLLLAGLPLAPAEVQGPFKHNLALCLAGLARQRGVLDALTAEPPVAEHAAPFVRAYAIPAATAVAGARVTVVVTDVASAAALRRTLAGIAAQRWADIDIVATCVAPATVQAEAQALLDDCGAPARLLVAPDAAPAAQANLAASAATGAHIAFLRAGDRWAPQWLAEMTAALEAFGVDWGYSGMRVVAEDDGIVRFGASPDLDALLRAQDGMYVHRTASLGFLAYDPIAAGRNLIVSTALWRRRGGIDGNAADPFLDWAWRTAREDEPLYLDEPGYLIPAGTERLHLHDASARMTAASARSPRAADRGAEPAATGNPHLELGLTRFWARQWRQVAALQGSTMAVEALQGCAATLGMARGAPEAS